MDDAGVLGSVVLGERMVEKLVEVNLRATTAFEEGHLATFLLAFLGVYRPSPIS